MRKNIFGLEHVLNFRKEVEKVRKMEFAAAKREFETAQDRLRGEEEKMDRVNTEFMDRQLAGMCAIELQMYSNFFNKKSADIKSQRHNVNNLNQNVSEKREVLLEAAVDKKVLEGLKEKKMKAHERDQAEKERAFLDELALRPGGESGR